MKFRFQLFYFTIIFFRGKFDHYNRYAGKYLDIAKIILNGKRNHPYVMFDRALPPPSPLSVKIKYAIKQFFTEPRGVGVRPSMRFLDPPPIPSI